MATTVTIEHTLKSIADTMFQLSELSRQSGLPLETRHSLQVKLVTCSRALNQLGYKVILSTEFLHIIPITHVEKLYFSGTNHRVYALGSQPISDLQSHILTYLEQERDRLRKKACHVRAHVGPVSALKLLKEIWEDGKQACSATA